jgi:hypothetical protein
VAEEEEEEEEEEEVEEEEEEEEEGCFVAQREPYKHGEKGPRRCPIARAELLLARLRDDTALGAADMAGCTPILGRAGPSIASKQ